MKFKSLYLQGFKSFVDKTVIDFPDGVTCIVGPNGSGKSNILDAIRWVFGEQSPKELRGSDMEDIIFAGSESRKPSNFAEVSLVVKDIPDNIALKWGTLSEIMITRKYYKTGEREYLINSRRCKLKDIKEIFYDTGIGARSISIIEQGRVEKIIQATPEQLRLFFEETAGVTKYKESKKEAEKRLHQTKENLNRINDIINEVKNSLSILLLQVEQLNNYKTLKQLKEEKEKIYFSNLYNFEKKRCEELINKLNSLKIEISHKISNFEEVRKSELSIKNRVASLEKEKDKINNIIIENNKLISELESDIKILKNNLESAENTKIHIRQEIENLTNKLKLLSESKETLVRENREYEENLEELESKIGELQESYEELKYQKDVYKEELNEIEVDYIKYTELITNKRNEIYKIENDIDRLEKDVVSFEKELIEIEANSAKVKDTYETAKRGIKEIESDIEILQNRSSSLKENLDGKLEEKGQILQEINRLKLALSSNSSKNKTLKEQLDLQLFGDTKTKELLSNFSPALFIDKNPQFAENFSKLYSDLLVFNISCKEELLHMIKDISGSMRFIFNNELESFIKNLALTNYDEISENIFKIGHIYYKVGEDSKNQTILNLKEEILYLDKEINTLNNKLKSMEDKYANLDKEIKLEEEEIKKIEASIMEFEKKLINDKNLLDFYERELKNMNERQQVVSNEKAFCEKELLSKREDLNKLKDSLKDVAEKQKELNSDREDLEEKINFYEEKMEDLKDEISSNKANAMVLNEKIKGNKKSIHITEREITNVTSNISNLKGRLHNLLTVNVSNWNASILEKTEQLKSAKLDKLKNEEVVHATLINIEEEKKRLSEVAGEMDKLDKEIKEIENLKNSYEVKLAEIKQQINSIKEQFAEKWEFQIEEIYEKYIVDNFNQSKVKSEIKEIVQKIEGLGALNLACEEEYKQVKERYDFLNKQKEDLENAYISINEIINEIDQNTIKNFSETFHKVNENFIKVFKILFGEGKAELKLTDSSNMLNTGVEIFVQPPGKKLQNMNLLSGGEKAMTACTLIFAMFLCKPTPFCFLDEIDAPLDDANIERFCKIVKTLSDKTQFIIITHNQKTMESADSLYGITMQEPGVSKVISVRLS